MTTLLVALIPVAAEDVQDQFHSISNPKVGEDSAKVSPDGRQAQAHFTGDGFVAFALQNQLDDPGLLWGKSQACDDFIALRAGVKEIRLRSNSSQGCFLNRGLRIKSTGHVQLPFYN